MSDVIIKGMEMPESCSKCFMIRSCRLTIPSNGRNNNCSIRPAPEWISVEIPPKVGERVILMAGVFVGEGYYTSAHTWYRITGIPMRDITDQPVTHWMPLPEPPEGGDGDG